jgi:hypothetical protein
VPQLIDHHDELLHIEIEFVTLATSTQFAMRLEFVAARLSGSALMFGGKQGGEWVLHEVFLDAADALEFVMPDHLGIVERFGPELERQTTVTARAPDAAKA